ncbi:MAG: PAS domain S-box protein [Alphaproteobacteria bacterium]
MAGDTPSSGDDRAGAYLAAIVASSDDAIIGKDLGGTITSWNSSAERIFGYPAAEAIGRSITMLIPEGRLAEEQTIIGKILKGERLEHFETVRRARDGTLLDISLTVSPIRDGNGTIIGASKIARDIGERRRLQAIAVSQKEALELVLDGAPLEDILAVLVNAAEANPASESRAAILLLDEDGRHLRLGAAPSLPQALRAQFDMVPVATSALPGAQAVRTREKIVVADIGALMPAGALRDMVIGEGIQSCWSQPILSGGGGVLGAFSVYFRRRREPSPGEIETLETLANTAGIIIERDRELRIRHAAEAALRESEQSWRALTEAMPQLVWGTRADGVCTYLSSQWTGYSGVPVGELLDHAWLGLLHDDDRERARLAWETAVAGRAGYDLDYRIRRHDGQYRWFRVRGVPVRDEAGAVVKWYGTCTDIQELVESRDAAQEANVAKSEFLANMSHEIRTPMNAVFGLANILARSKPLTAQQAEFIHTLQLSADALLALINDLLDIAKIEARTVELEQAPFSLDTLMQEVANIMSVRAREKRLAFTASDECLKGRRFVGDATRLRQVIMNLCSNAVKFTEEGGVHVTVTCRPSALPGTETVCIEVSDTGIGIAGDKIDAIFQKFVQADNSINRKYGGTGLGLAIARTLTELMGGTIEVSSAPGRGSRFTVALPLRTDTGDAAESPRVERPAATVAAPRRARILLVEDYAPNVLVAKTVLDQFGYECDVAANAPRPSRRSSRAATRSPSWTCRCTA